MPSPRASSAYPYPMLRALERAVETGELFIPCDDTIKPNNLRLQFYGLLGALKREGKPEFGETLQLTLATDPPGLRLAWRDTGKIGALVQRALEADLSESSADPSESSLFESLTGGPAK